VLARWLVGGMFAYMAYMKLLDPILFMKETREYGFLPESMPILLNLTAVIVPWLELLCAIALIVGLWTRGAAVIIFGMLMFFTPLVTWRAIGLYTAPDAAFTSFCAVKFDCGCGTGEVYICWKIFENTLLQIGCLIAFLGNTRLWSVEGLLARWRGHPTTTSPAPSAAVATERQGA
jgi:uncharacterized membrane protein YphA (DoxX/SURF4 family)